MLTLVMLGCGPAGNLGGALSSGSDAAEQEPEQKRQVEADRPPQTCTAPTLSALAAEIFAPECSGCHAGPDAPESLDLTLEPEHLRRRLMQPAAQSPSKMPLVTPGSIGSSYLYLKVAVTTPLIGERMPKDGEPLDDCLTASLETWIEAGAP